MTLTQTQERTPAAERIAVRCVDSDVHPVPKRGRADPVHPGAVAEQALPRLARSASQSTTTRRTTRTPYAMRVDTFPPDGEFPGSDPTCRSGS